MTRARGSLFWQTKLHGSWTIIKFNRVSIVASNSDLPCVVYFIDTTMRSFRFSHAWEDRSSLLLFSLGTLECHGPLCEFTVNFVLGPLTPSVSRGARYNRPLEPRRHMVVSPYLAPRHKSVDFIDGHHEKTPSAFRFERFTDIPLSRMQRAAWGP